MFEKFNEQARRALFFARYEASKLGSRVIENEHVVLGILREGEESVLALLSLLGLKPEDVRRKIEGDRESVKRASSTAELPLSEDSKRILAYAVSEAEGMADSIVCSDHLLIGFLRLESSLATWILAQAGRDLDGVREEALALARERQADKVRTSLPWLSKHGTDLTLFAAQGRLDPLIGRDEVLERMVLVLCLRGKKNVLLHGASGVGKKAVVRGLAQRIADGRVPLYLREKRVFQLDLDRLVSGIRSYEGSKKLLDGSAEELRKIKDVLIFVDDVHVFFSGRDPFYPIRAGILRTFLLSKEVQCIGAATPDGYHRYMKGIAGTARHFTRVFVPEPLVEETVRILQASLEPLESHHGVTYTDDAIETAIASCRGFSDFVLPGRAIHLLDACGSHLKATEHRGESGEARGEEGSESLVVTPEVVEEVASSLAEGREL